MGKRIEECYFCGEENDCTTECRCSKCIFPTKLNEWGAENPEIREFYLKSNELFYEILFVKAKEFENRLFLGWRKSQLSVLKEVSTNVGDWTSDEIEFPNGVEPEIKNGYKERKLFYEFRYVPKTNHNGPLHCQICGTNLKIQTIIECSRLHMAVVIGTECGKNFRFAEEMYKDMKKNIDIIIRKDFALNLRSIKKQRESLLRKSKTKTQQKAINYIVKRMKALNRRHNPIPTVLVLINNLLRAEKIGFQIDLVRQS